MTGLERIEKEIYYTYHDKNNKDILPIVIFFSVICLVFKAAILFELLIWGLYYYYCMSNNAKLNNDPKNIANRNRLIKLRQKILTGEAQFKN